MLSQDLKLEFEHLSRNEAMKAAECLAHIVGRAHVRQFASETCAAWLGDLQHGRSRSLDAPSWLWDAVVDLVGARESAYLQHCRRFALEAA